MEGQQKVEGELKDTRWRFDKDLMKIQWSCTDGSHPSKTLQNKKIKPKDAFDFKWNSDQDTLRSHI